MCTGLCSFITVLFASILIGKPLLILFGLFFLLVFGGIGFTVFWFGFRVYLKKKKIISQGVSLQARIIDYEDNTSSYLNGMPLLDLIVLFEMSGIKKIARLGTSTSNISKYPINSQVEVSVLGNQIVLK